MRSKSYEKRSLFLKLNINAFMAFQSSLNSWFISRQNCDFNLAHKNDLYVVLLSRCNQKINTMKFKINSFLVVKVDIFYVR